MLLVGLGCHWACLGLISAQGWIDHNMDALVDCIHGQIFSDTDGRSHLAQFIIHVVDVKILPCDRLGNAGIDRRVGISIRRQTASMILDRNASDQIRYGMKSFVLRRYDSKSS